MAKKSKKKNRASKLLQAASKNAAVKKIKNWHSSLSKKKRALLYLLLSVVFLFALSALVDASFREVKNPAYGVSFSKKYSEELGLDWRENYTALLDDLEIRNFRLMSYWDEVEPSRGNYNFSDLDWQMKEAEKRGAKVSLTLGMRQPRWPECHKPDWYALLSAQEKREALMDFVTKVVNRYKDAPNLASYQLENEALNTWFGECTADDIDKQRLIDEFNLVKSLDPKHPVWMSLSDQHGLPLGEPVPDKYGYSVYRIVYNDKTGPFQFYMTYPTPLWYHHLRAAWIKQFKDRDIFIHELQLEPWGPVATKDLTIEEQNRSMNTEQIKENISFARKIGAPEIYTWGGEWWYWRKVVHHDPSMWETMRAELNRN